MNDTDQGIFIPNEDAESEQPKLNIASPEPNETLIGGIQCPKCDRMFKNDQALRMHTIRKHSNRGWNTGANFGTKKSKGGNKGMTLPKWSPSRLAKFRRTMRQKAESRNHSVKVAAQPKVAANPGVVTFCPRCGCNIKVVAAAIAFGDRQ